MWFTQKKVTDFPLSSRFEVMIGGGGTLGKALVAALPPNTVFINVSRTRMLLHERVINVSADVTTMPPEAVFARILARVPRIDVLVFGAYMSHFVPLEHISPTQLDHEFALLCRAPLFLFQTFLTYCTKENEHAPFPKRLIVIGSGAYRGNPTDRPDLGSYAACKAFTHQMTRTFARTFAQVNVQVNAIHPGAFSDQQILNRTVATLWHTVTCPTSRTTYTHYEFF